MSGYSTPLKAYYAKYGESLSDANRIAPAPIISISPEIFYANDNPIGYNYNITLKGSVNALRKELDAGSTNTGISGVIDHIGHIRDVFNVNGGDLYLNYNNNNTLVAKGATIKSLNIEQSDNKWINFAPYTIELQFNEIDFIGCNGGSTIPCSNSIFHQIVNSKNINNNIIDITKFKIKEFKDGWSFSSDDKIYDTINPVVSVSYNISVTGQNYYVNGKLIPAWQQARLFAQKKLYSQVASLVNNTLQIESGNSDGCNGTKDLTQLHATSGGDGIFAPTWEVFNETINCQTSEANGTFSVTYNAILKKSTSPALHTFTKDISISYSDGIDATVTIKGNVQGLIVGGFIYNTSQYLLPASGSFIIPQSGSNDKYTNAATVYSSIVTATVTPADLLISSEVPISISATSTTIEHLYSQGAISYTNVYNRKNLLAKSKDATNISIVRNESVPLIKQFTVPGVGTVVQKLNSFVPATISINIDGASNELKNCTVPSGTDICNLQCYIPTSINEYIPTNGILTKDDCTINTVDGSFSISREYIIPSG